MSHKGVETATIRAQVMKLTDEVRLAMSAGIRDSLQYLLACIEEKRLENAKDEIFALKETLRRWGL